MNLTLEETAKLTGLAKQTIYNFCYKRTIPHFKQNNKLLFRKEDVERWIESRIEVREVR